MQCKVTVSTFYDFILKIWLLHNTAHEVAELIRIQCVEKKVKVLASLVRT